MTSKQTHFTIAERLPLDRLRHTTRLPFASAELPAGESLREKARVSEQERFSWLENQIANEKK